MRLNLQYGGALADERVRQATHSQLTHPYVIEDICAENCSPQNNQSENTADNFTVEGDNNAKAPAGATIIAATRRQACSEACTRLGAVRLLAMDVDGVLTDGTIALSDANSESKWFHVADGLGIVLMRFLDVQVAWITGRAGAHVERRARELKVEHVCQRARNKAGALNRLSEHLHIPQEQTAYIGDDLNDIPALRAAGVAIAVANACEEVKQTAHVVCTRSGGYGAVREVCEWLMDARDRRAETIAAYLDSLQQPDTLSSDLQIITNADASQCAGHDSRTAEPGYLGQ